MNSQDRTKLLDHANTLLDELKDIIQRLEIDPPEMMTRNVFNEAERLLGKAREEFGYMRQYVNLQQQTEARYSQPATSPASDEPRIKVRKKVNRSPDCSICKGLCVVGDKETTCPGCNGEGSKEAEDAVYRKSLEEGKWVGVV